MYIIIVRESKYIKYIFFLVVFCKVFRLFYVGVILYMDLYICCIFISICIVVVDLLLDELLICVGEN